MSCEIVLVSILKICLLRQGQLFRMPKHAYRRIFKRENLIRENRDRNTFPEQSLVVSRLLELPKLVNAKQSSKESYATR